MKLNNIQTCKKLITSHTSMVLAALAIGILTLVFGERLNPFGMLGDEKIFYYMVKDFQNVLFGKVLTEYFILRLLPAGLVYGSLKILARPDTVENVVLCYGIWNTALLGVSAFFWGRISKVLSLTCSARWLGFLALFVNFPVMKFIPFTQVTTDCFAYAAGLALIYFYLKDRFWGMLVVLILSSFIWPVAKYAGFLLIAFPRDVDASNDREENSPDVLIAPWVIAACALGIFIWRVSLIFPYFENGSYIDKGIFTFGIRPVMPVLYLSVGLMAGYIFLGVAQIFNCRNFYQWSYWKLRAKRILFRVLVLVFVVAGLQFVIGHLSGSKNHFPVEYLLFDMIASGTIAPGMFWVAHVIYFGPILACLLLLWKPVCQQVHRYGLAVPALLGLTLAVSIHSESRLLMMFYPMIVPFLIKALDRFSWTWIGWLCWLVISAVYSKFWLRFHPASDWSSDSFDFPKQFYYMNFGHHMSHSMYLLQGAVVLITTAVIFYVLFGSRLRQRNNQS